MLTLEQKSAVSMRSFDLLGQLQGMLPNEHEQVLAIEVHGQLCKAYNSQVKSLTGLIVDGKRAVRICRAAMALAQKTVDEAAAIGADEFDPKCNIGS